MLILGFSSILTGMKFIIVANFYMTGMHALGQGIGIRVKTIF
jgi:hypothetical protein